MATPYNPALNPYIINPKELPANQAAAARVPAVNVGTANQWCQSPYFTPNWGDESQGPQPLGGPPPAPYLPGPGTAAQGPAQAVSPVATPGATRPDSAINARDIAANAALNAEKARQQAVQTAAGNAITGIGNITGGAPGIYSVSPATVLHTSTVLVTILGSGFSVSAPTVTIGTACTGVTVVDDGELTCTTAVQAAAGTVNVVVTTTAGTATLTNGFVYT